VDPADPGPFVSGFAAWLEAGHGAIESAARHVGDAKEFLAWYGANRHEDVVGALRQYVQCAPRGQAGSMRLLEEWLSDR
jgi:hypothetical protein